MNCDDFEDKELFMETIEKDLKIFNYLECPSFEFKELFSEEIICIDIVDHELYSLIAEIQ